MDIADQGDGDIVSGCEVALPDPSVSVVDPEIGEDIPPAESDYRPSPFKSFTKVSAYASTSVSGGIGIGSPTSPRATSNPA